MKNRLFFRRLARELGGLCRPRVYQQYYRLARDESRYSIIELGTGQGASTVALATGIIDSGRKGTVQAIDQFYQMDRGVHPAGRNEHGDDASEMNLRAYCRNLANYSVADRVKVHRAKTTEVELDFDAEGPFDMLVIDVDGYLDRDLGLFYDCLLPHGIIVIDDYRDIVNHQGQRLLRKFSRLGLETARKKISRMSSYQRGRLLGKHILTHRFVDRMETAGLLDGKSRIGGTLFCRKAGDARFADRFTQEDARAVEESIVRDFLSLFASGRSGLTLAQWFENQLKRPLRWVMGRP